MGSSMNSSPIRVMHIISSLRGGGAERQLAKSLEFFYRSNILHQVCCIRDGGIYEAPIRRLGIPVTILPNQLRLDPRIIIRLIRLLRQEKIDVVHTYNFTANSWGRLAAWIARVPLILASEHGTAWTENRIMRLASKWLYPISSLVIAISNAGKIILTHKICLPEQKIRVIPLGITPPNSQVGNMSLRHYLRVDPDSLIIGAIGRLNTAKGHHIFLNAIPRVLQEIPNVHFVIIGEGPLHSWLENLSHELGFGSSGHFHMPGFLPDASMFIGEFDILVHPSIRDALPTTLIEAAWMGVPTVTSNVDGCPEIVVNGESGILIDCTQPLSDIPNRDADPLPELVVDGKTHSLRPPAEIDPQVLASSIVNLLKNPTLMKVMGNNARIIAEERFTMDRYVKDWEALYRLVKK
jgi:glycosyltransferase involved in cell wall biosynthesis